MSSRPSAMWATDFDTGAVGEADEVTFVVVIVLVLQLTEIRTLRMQLSRECSVSGARRSSAPVPRKRGQGHRDAPLGRAVVPGAVGGDPGAGREPDPSGGRAGVQDGRDEDVRAERELVGG